MDNNIDLLRERVGLTVQELADKAGLTRGYLNKLKAGRARFNSHTLQKLSEALDCTAADIIASPFNLQPIVKQKNEATTFSTIPPPILYTKAVLIAKIALESHNIDPTEAKIHELARLIIDVCQKMEIDSITLGLAEWLLVKVPR